MARAIARPADPVAWYRQPVHPAAIGLHPRRDSRRRPRRRHHGFGHAPVERQRRGYDGDDVVGVLGRRRQVLGERGVVDVDTSAKGGDPTVGFPETGRGEDKAFLLLTATVTDLGKGKGVPLSGLKDEMRKTDDSFSEGRYGYSGFLQFVKAAKAQGVVTLDFDAASGAYSVTVANT